MLIPSAISCVKRIRPCNTYFKNPVRDFLKTHHVELLRKCQSNSKTILARLNFVDTFDTFDTNKINNTLSWTSQGGRGMRNEYLSACALMDFGKAQKICLVAPKVLKISCSNDVLVFEL